MKEILKVIFNFLNTWKAVIIFFGLGAFALYVTAKFIIFVINKELGPARIYEIIGVSFLIFLLSFIVSKLFPDRFTHWEMKWWKEELRGQKKLTDKLLAFLILVILFSPLTIFFISLGLSFFIFSFIRPDVNLLWENIILGGETIYQILGAMSFGFFVPILLFIVLALILVKFKKESFIKYIIVIFVFTLIILNIFRFTGLPPLLKEFENMLSKNLTIAIKFILGCIPLGWFYELFIGSIAREKENKANIY